MKEQRDKLSRGALGCNFECRSSYLGALIQRMHATGILPILEVDSPKVDPSEAPHRGLSLSSVIDGIRGIPFPDVYIKRTDVLRPFLHKCELEQSLKNHANELDIGIGALNLHYFVSQ